MPDRIVNLVQRHVRPIVRGKARAAVEFGAKISVSVRNGFAFLHRISWDPYNEAEDLITQAKKHKQKYGCYPERICADRIYINTKNRNFCTRNNIRLSGKRLGRPPKDQAVTAVYKQQLYADQRRRNEVEGCLVSGKSKYSLDLIMARLPIGAENSISMAFVVMCADKILRLLRLFFCLYHCLAICLAMARLPLDGAQEHLAAWIDRITAPWIIFPLSCLRPALPSNRDVACGSLFQESPIILIQYSQRFQHRPTYNRSKTGESCMSSPL